MSLDRLPTHLWVGAALRNTSASGAFGAIIKRGEQTSGIVLLRINLLNRTSLLLIESRDLDGERIWHGPLGKDPIEDAEADAYIDRAIARDPDLWVVEFEDQAGRNPFDM